MIALSDPGSKDARREPEVSRARPSCVLGRNGGRTANENQREPKTLEPVEHLEPLEPSENDTIFAFVCGRFLSTPSPTPRKHVYQAAVRTPLIKLDLPLMPPAGRRRKSTSSSNRLQPIGSFKIRGAWNAIRKLSKEKMKDGVWTVSAGNAAQGVAFAARLAGVPCSVMVMDTAPQTKLRSIETPRRHHRQGRLTTNAGRR